MDTRKVELLIVLLFIIAVFFSKQVYNAYNEMYYWRYKSEVSRFNYYSVILQRALVQRMNKDGCLNLYPTSDGSIRMSLKDGCEEGFISL